MKQKQSDSNKSNNFPFLKMFLQFTMSLSYSIILLTLTDLIVVIKQAMFGFGLWFLKFYV